MDGTSFLLKHESDGRNGAQRVRICRVFPFCDKYLPEIWDLEEGECRGGPTLPLTSKAL